MAKGVVAAIGAAWRDPRAAMARQMREGATEERALFHLMAACGLGFLASLPAAIRNARTVEADDALAATVGGHLFGFLFVAPLLMYGVAALVHLGARAFGAKGPYIRARVALFWALLVGAPIALGLALIGVAAEVAFGAGVLRWLAPLGYAGLALWLWIFGSSLAEAEGFAHGGRVTAALAAGFGGLAVLVAVLASGAASAGG
jgi:hypothetical protein